MYISVFPLYVSTHHMYTVHIRPEEGIGSPRSRIRDVCEPQAGCQELNPGPLDEQLVLLTAKLSLQQLV